MITPFLLRVLVQAVKLLSSRPESRKSPRIRLVMRMVLLIFESSFRLFVVETLIECIVGIKFRVRATGNDLPAIENEDSVGMLNRTEAVGDNHYRASLGELLERRLDLVLANGV